ncbi:ATP-dependent dethiobiotin synthetase BioD [Actinospongicola halichondriae]|uniref:ATP-dependent dethiobiotin synthetase BioD n=1 Tax=Actinospongicola halichondriae TaxID=3236844 RepID=UPI003D583954
MRPRLLVGVAGTATEIGKTWTSAALASDLRRRGLAVGARKPVQSYEPTDTGPLDAEVLAAALGVDPDEVCPPHRTLPVPMAPPMAADALGRPRPVLADLVAETVWADGLDVGLLESVGGVASPIADDGDSTDLLRSCEVDVTLLVADAGLGTIDAVRTALRYLGRGPVVVALNRFDPLDDLHRRNLDWLRTTDELDPCTSVGAVADRLVELLPNRR